MTDITSSRTTSPEQGAPQPVVPPRTAYVLLWFPEPTQTFIYREALGLARQGLPLSVYTLYGRKDSKLTEEMRRDVLPTRRLGIGYALRALPEVVRWFIRRPGTAAALWRRIPLRKWGGLEKAGENLWGFLCGFRLATWCEQDGIEHIHAPWAGGPATAAWVASRLTGIPYSFTARAYDIHPPDGALTSKTRDAAFVRVNAGSNIPHMRSFAGEEPDKIRLVYNGAPLSADREAPVALKEPVKLLAIGRLVPKKGFAHLLDACGLLRARGFDFHLTVAGSGPLEGKLRSQVRRLGIEDAVDFSGHVPHDRVRELFMEADMFVMSSVIDPTGNRDGIPNVIMEAFAHRLPVIGTDVSGIGELVEEGVTGFLVPPEDPAALADAVMRAAGDREASLRLAEAGRERVLREFDPETSCRRIIGLLAEFTS